MPPLEPPMPPRDAPEPRAPVPVDAFRPKEVHVQPKASRGMFQVQKHPRLVGAACVGVGGILALFDYAIYASDHSFYVQLMILTPTVGAFGMWMVATGQPLHPATGKPRAWWRVGAVAAVILGALVGIVVSVAIS